MLFQNTVGSGFDRLSGIENVTGTNFADTLIGNAGSNVLNGLAGNDLLTGGAGRDILTGGSGFDTFDYNAASDSPASAGRDVITDFQGNGIFAGDRIDLSTIDANLFAFGNQAFFPGQLSYNQGAGLLSINILGNLSPVDMQIQLTAGTPLVIRGPFSDIIL
ncbi:MAG: hypothetical protein E8D52_10555 [Nitrospira sp.]|nr:MAG: hypothetical protein E8D52_10555 [Nitrospira sp.]